MPRFPSPRALLVVTTALTTGLSAPHTWADDAPALRVCMAENNAPLSYQFKRDPMKGLDVALAQAIADHLRRPLRIVPFESELEDESTLSQEVNAMLSSDVCDVASGFPLLHQDLGKPTKEVSRTPEYPGAKRYRERPWITLGTLINSRPYQASAMTLVVIDPRWAQLSLQDIGDARLGATAGTLSGAATMMFNGGQWRSRVVNLSRDDDPLVAVDSGQVDAVLVSQSRLDNWRRKHADSQVRSTGYLHPMRLNIGLVALDSQQAIIDAASAVISQAQSSGDLARWAAASGVTYLQPEEPHVSFGPNMASLMQAK